MSNKITVDGMWGNDTTKLLQSILQVGTDGIISGQDKSAKEYLRNIKGWTFNGGGSITIKKLQGIIGTTADGYFGKNSIIALQKYLGIPADGYLGAKTVRAFQAQLNTGYLPAKVSGETPHFKKEEFKCGCGGKYCKGYPAGNMSSGLLLLLERIRTHYGNAPVKITSGQRCKRFNAQVGGIATSQHLEGKAADFYIKGICDTAEGRSEVVKIAKLYGAAYSYANTKSMGKAVHINI